MGDVNSHNALLLMEVPRRFNHPSSIKCMSVLLLVHSLWQIWFMTGNVRQSWLNNFPLITVSKAHFNTKKLQHHSESSPWTAKAFLPQKAQCCSSFQFDFDMSFGQFKWKFSVIKPTLRPPFRFLLPISQASCLLFSLTLKSTIVHKIAINFTSWIRKCPH